MNTIPRLLRDRELSENKPAEVKPCNCIELITENAANHLKESIEKKTTVHEWHEKGRFKNIGYGINDRSVKIGMPFIVTYTRRKNNGEPERKETTQEVSVYPSYCPFCGQKFPESKEEEKQP